MAAATKARWAQLKVGLMSLLALLILGYLIILMTGQKGLFQPTSQVYTYLNDSIAIAQGADVRLNGILIGNVASVGLSGSAERDRVVRVTMQIDNQYLASIPVDSEASLAAQNLLGVKYMNIKKGQSEQAIQAGAEIRSKTSGQLEDLFEQGGTTLAALQSILKRLDGIISQIEVGKGTIGQLLVDDTMARKINGIADEMLKLSKTMNASDSTLGKLLHEDTLYQDFRSTMARVNNLLDGVNQGQGTLGKLLKDPSLFDDFRMTIADVRKTIAGMDDLLAGLNRGEGTAGKLLKSEELHEQFKNTMARLDTLLDKVNNGQGTISQLLNNPQLYEDLDASTREIQGLLRDFRANPKKFLTIQLKLF